MKRFIVVLIGAPILILVPFSNVLIFSVFTALISFLASWEFGNLLQKKEIVPLKTTMYFSAFCSLIVQGMGVSYLLPYLLFCSLVMMLIVLFKKEKNPLIILSGNLFSLIYTGVFFSLLVVLLQDYGAYFVLFIYTAIWCTDIFAYLGGMLCNKLFKTHKLFVRVSPKKTIEGAIIGCISAILFVLGIFVFLKRQDLIYGFDLKEVLIVVFVACSFGQIGDLVESLFKRDCEVKDSSQLIPGHGGILDRFDSLIFVVPIIYIVLEVI